MNQSGVDEYFLRIAETVSARSSCHRRQVGAVAVVDGHVATTGYNGTVSGVLNCNEGGCARCASATASGADLGLCTCVHAEANALLQAAKYGPKLEGATLYTTVQPCLTCLLLSISAGIKRIVYREPYQLPKDVQHEYRYLLSTAGLVEMVCR